MASLTKIFADGGRITLSPSQGGGDMTISVSADVNEGVDREVEIIVKGNGVSRKTFKIAQLGKRQQFITTDNKVMYGSDKRFLVLK